MTDWISRAEAACEAATEGPWKCWNGWPAEPKACERVGPDIAGGISGKPDIYGNRADFEFIALARTAFPRALKALRAADELFEKGALIDHGSLIYFLDELKKNQPHNVSIEPMISFLLAHEKALAAYQEARK